MYFYIYKTVNKVNGMEYIGCHSTENLEDGYLGSGIYLKRAIKKYGKENFEKTILEYCNDLKDMIEKEKEYVDEEWCSKKNTYNLQTGGLNYGTLTESSKKKISISVKKRHKEGAYKNNKKRNPMGEEAKKKISDSLKKRYETHEHHTIGSIPWNLGIKMSPMTEETKKKISESSKKFMSKPENRKKISDSLKKRYETHEHHLKGKEPWNKGKNMGPSWNKGIPDVKIKCPHCNKVGGRSNMKRWHFDNCRKNNKGKREN